MTVRMREALKCDVILCETRGTWAAAVRQGVRLPEFQGFVWRWQEVRSLDHCDEELARQPQAGVVLEARRANLSELLQRLTTWEQRFPQAACVLVADPGLAACEWVLREAGAVHVHYSRRRLDAVLRLLVRHQLRQPLPSRSLPDALWQSLPWQRLAPRVPNEIN